MKKIPLSQGKFAIVDDDDFAFLSQWKWYYNKGYAARFEHLGMIGGKQKRRMIYMHRVVAKTPDGMKTDHINGDTIYNIKANLRICTHKENLRNMKPNQRSSSTFKGVCWHKREQRWMAQISYNKKMIFLGYFNREENAAIAYNFAAMEKFGEFARFNKAA